MIEPLESRIARGAANQAHAVGPSRSAVTAQKSDGFAIHLSEV